MIARELTSKISKLTEDEQARISEHVDELLNTRQNTNKVIGYVTPGHPVTVQDLLDSAEESDRLYKQGKLKTWGQVRGEMLEKYGIPA